MYKIENGMSNGKMRKLELFDEMSMISVGWSCDG
jgi:hypothetical protein